jgi:restriction endonuclease-like protein
MFGVSDCQTQPMELAKRPLAEAIANLPERQKLFASLSFFEELDDKEIAETLAITREEVAALASETRLRLAAVAPLSSREASAARAGAEEALRARLREITGGALDRAGRGANLSEAFVPSIGTEERDAIERDIRQGGGGELRVPKDPTLAPRFHSARSSCALAVNAFGPWRLHPETLSISDFGGFTSLRFERKCPIKGVPPKREPPNLDVIAEGDRIVAVESKLIEYLTSKREAQFDDVYEARVGELADTTWTAAYERLKSSPEEFQCLGAAQIVKHYLGLKSVFPARQVTLLYVYWEPLDRDQHRLFVLHEAEIASFAEGLADPDITFASMTYAELWDEWSEQAQPDWLTSHVKALRARYLVSTH